MAAEALLYIVEDDAAFARTLQRSFERRGYRVADAGQPRRAAELQIDDRIGRRLA